MLDQGGRDGRRELLDLGDERREDRYEGLDQFAAGLRLRLAGAAARGATEAGQQLGRGTAPAGGVAAEELRQAALPEPLGALGRGVAGEEGERDRGIHVGEDGRGAGPEALEEGAELIGEGDALGDEVIAAADEGAEGAGLIGEGQQGAEAVAIGPEQVAEQVGVAGVALAASGRVAGAAGLHGIGVDRDDREAGVQEGIDDEAGGALEGDGQRGGGREAGQPLDELGQARCGVGHRPAPADGAGLVEHTNSVRGGGPVQADDEGHCVPPWDCETLPRERSCRSLTDWRSGLQVPVALHPVAGWGLSWCESREQVSYWPSRGKPMGLSSTPGTVIALTIRHPRPRHQETRSPGARRSHDLGPTHISVSPLRGSCLSPSREG